MLLIMLSVPANVPSNRESDNAAKKKPSIVRNLFTFKQPEIGEAKDFRERTERSHEQVRKQHNVVKKKNISYLAPAGILGIHVKEVHMNFFDIYKILQKNQFAFYIRFILGPQMKYTCRYNDVTTPCTIITDEMKFMVLRPSAKRFEQQNYLLIEFIVLDMAKPTSHTILCSREIHVFDIIKHQLDIRYVELRYADRVFGEIELEMCFQYGTFGYGTSNQFENRQKTFADQVMHSMHYRSLPPMEQLDAQSGTLKCSHVGHPDFLIFNQKSSIQPVGDLGGQSFVVLGSQQIPDPDHVMKRLGPFYTRHVRDYNKISTRIERVDFYQSLFPNSQDHDMIDHENFRVPASFRLKMRSAQKRSDAEGVARKKKKEKAKDQLSMGARLVNTVRRWIGGDEEQK